KMQALFERRYASGLEKAKKLLVKQPPPAAIARPAAGPPQPPQSQPQAQPKPSLPKPAPDAPLRDRMLFVVDKLISRPAFAVFAQPVNVNDAPDYLRVIAHPMDLGSVRQRLLGGVYDTNKEAFMRDMRLVWTNCQTYNQRESDIYVLSQ